VTITPNDPKTNFAGVIFLNIALIVALLLKILEPRKLVALLIQTVDNPLRRAVGQQIRFFYVYHVINPEIEYTVRQVNRPAPQVIYRGE
jgi:hypothetical protein